MTRDMRFKFIGVIFYVFLITPLLLTQKALYTIGNAQNGLSQAQVILGVLSLGAMLLTSDAIGYAFGTVFLAIGGGKWSKVWGQLNPKRIMLERFPVLLKEDPATQCYLQDVYFSYLWQQAPKELQEWPMRRHLGFINNWSMVIAIFVAFIIGLVASVAGLGLTPWQLIPGILGILFSIMLGMNAQQNKKELTQFVSVCFYCADLDKWLKPCVEKHAEARSGQTDNRPHPTG